MTHIIDIESGYILYRPNLDKWECSGMKIPIDIKMYKNGSLIYHWGFVHNQDLNDKSKFPYRESGYKGTKLGTFPCDYDSIDIITSNDKFQVIENNNCIVKK